MKWCCFWFHSEVKFLTRYLAYNRSAHCSQVSDQCPSGLQFNMLLHTLCTERLNAVREQGQSRNPNHVFYQSVFPLILAQTQITNLDVFALFILAPSLSVLLTMERDNYVCLLKFAYWVCLMTFISFFFWKQRKGNTSFWTNYKWVIGTCYFILSY